MPSLPELAWFLRAVATAIRVEALLRMRDLPRVCRALGVAPPGPSPNPLPTVPTLTPQLRARAEQAVGRAYRKLPLPDSCLRRALTLGSLLREYHPTLCVGVRRRAEDLDAHAWLVVGGQEFKPQDLNYAVLRS
ncbi:MAG: hypothetical protein RJA70_281 [Pseudomonadota bacterium]|jgi:hypothetical protein